MRTIFLLFVAVAVVDAGSVSDDGIVAGVWTVAGLFVCLGGLSSAIEEPHGGGRTESADGTSASEADAEG